MLVPLFIVVLLACSTVVIECTVNFVTGYSVTTYYLDSACSLEPLWQKVAAYNLCYKGYFSQNNTQTYRSFNHQLEILSTTTGEYRTKRLNFDNQLCQDSISTTEVVTGTLNKCVYDSTALAYAKLIYSPGDALPYIGAFGLRKSYYITPEHCQGPNQLSQEYTYQQNACINMGTYSVSYSCAGTIYTKKTFLDTQCVSLQETTGPVNIPAACQRNGYADNSNDQAYETMICAPQLAPTGYVMSKTFAAPACNGSIADVQQQSVGMCYQKYNLSLNGGEIIGSYKNEFVPDTDATKFTLKLFDFADGRCAADEKTAAETPGSTTCIENAPTSVLTTYLNSTAAVVPPADGIMLTYYSSSEACQLAGAFSTRYVYKPGSCVNKGSSSASYSFDGTTFTVTTYTDGNCKVVDATQIISALKCINYSGTLTSNEAMFETVSFVGTPPAPGMWRLY